MSETGYVKTWLSGGARSQPTHCIVRGRGVFSFRHSRCAELTIRSASYWKTSIPGTEAREGKGATVASHSNCRLRLPAAGLFHYPHDDRTIRKRPYKTTSSLPSIFPFIILDTGLNRTSSLFLPTCLFILSLPLPPWWE